MCTQISIIVHDRCGLDVGGCVWRSEMMDKSAIKALKLVEVSNGGTVERVSRRYGDGL